VRTFNKKTLLIGTLLSSALVSTEAFAQSADADEIVVTGSRIQRDQDFVANSPVATVDDVQFERTGTLNTEQLLNVVPQTVPGLTRTSNNPGNGTASVDLRGLGSNRTLVLVNGRRAQPTGSSGVVDINTIPPSLIDQVEVLTGGASSVYGADAVAGVVNFILKDDFEGVEASVGGQATDRGDAENFNLSLTVGGNFADDRGNAVVSIGYTDRSDLFQGDRDFSTVALFDNGAGDGLEPGGSSGVPGTSIFSGALGGFSPDSFGITFNPDGSARPFVTGGDVNDFYNYAPVNYLQLPQERYSVYGKADFEINEHFVPYVEARFVQSQVPQQLAPTPIFQTSEFSIDGSPFLTAGTQQVLSDAFGSGVDTDGDGIDDTGTAFLRRRLLEVGPRIGNDNRNTFQAILGMEGMINDQFDYDVFYSEGRTNNSSFQTGNVNRGRFSQALLLADADGDGNADGATCADGSTNGSTVGCSPLNIFGQGNISPDAAAFIETAVSTTDETIQRVLQGNIIGDLGDAFRLTDEPVGIAIGAEYIENSFIFRPSQDVAASTIAGFNGAPPVEGGFNTYSAYGELYVPLLADKSFAQSVNLDLAGRVSDFSTSGTKFNYKIGGDWTVNDMFRVRGNYNTAVRAPNINELFSPSGENFPGAGAGDPCSAARYGDGTIPAAVRDLCEAQGVPADVIGTAALNLAANQVRTLVAGNPDLDVETAQTFTIGAVITPDILDSFSLSVDYYDISIDDAIGLFGGGGAQILNGCYFSPAGGLGTEICAPINRRADGTIDFIDTPTFNTAGIDTSGIDVALRTSLATDMLGEMYFSYLGTYVLDNEFQAGDAAQVFDCAGRFGNNCGEPDPEYRHFATLGTSKGMWNGQVTWQMLGSVDDGGDLDQFDPTTQVVNELGTEHYFNASMTADLSDNLALTFGVNNLLDNNPPVIGDNDEQANTYPSTYDVFGRTFFANAKVSF